MAGQYWLVKCEPDGCSFDGLKQRPQSTGYWRGVRNYQARNLIRDSMEEGIWRSSITPTATSRGSPESRRSQEQATPIPANSTTSTATTDEKSTEDEPRWFSFDVKWKRKFKRFVHLADLKANDKLADMRVVQRGQRLSIQPVAEQEWKEVCKMGGVRPT